jgi:hypothetical protein
VKRARPALAPRRVALLLALLGLLACTASYGGVKLTVSLVGDARTRCLRSWASTADGKRFFSDALPRRGDRLVLGVRGSEELTGTVAVGVDLFEADDCAGAAFATAQDVVTLERGKVTARTFVFDFSAPTDGGSDAGLDAGLGDGGADGGDDAGCSLTSCPAPADCRGPASACSATSCAYPLLPEGTACGDGGVCSATGSCGANVCAFRAGGAPCDDGLTCTTQDTCVSGVCLGVCAPHPHPTCNSRVTPPLCGADGGCAWIPKPPNGACPLAGGETSGRCNRAGWCDPWFAVAPSNLPDDVTALPQPQLAWTASPGADGGPCIIDTGGSMPGPRDPAADCGFREAARTLIQDGGVELVVFPAASLVVPPDVELHFVGARPAVLAIFGDATVQGTLSAAAASSSLERPSGSGGLACAAPVAAANGEGGMGGSYRTTGGQGGNSMQAASPINGAVTGMPLRGGCAGSPGGGASAGAGGAGGGALQLSVVGALLVGDGGVLSVSGAGGSGGLSESGAGGGGSGGTLLLEARSITLVNCALTANGGGGGQGGRNGQPAGASGADGARTTSAAAAGGATTTGPSGGSGGALGQPAGDGASGGGLQGGGGGGGAVGLIRLNTLEGCTRSNVVRSGELSANRASCSN